MSRLRKILRTAGSVCCIYGLAVLLLIGGRSWFNYAFPAAGLVLLLLARFADRIFPLKRWMAFPAALLLLLFLLFLVFEIRILLFPLRGPEPGADYVLLLGCQVRGETPSLDYAARIRAAAEYLEANPTSLLIACGGQGDTEDISEAEAARRVLIRDYGIDPERILTEDRSVSTLENLTFARDLLLRSGADLSRDRFVLVSAPYHLFRACRVARDLGYENVSCRGGNGLFLLLPQAYCREFAAYVKYVVVTACP